MKPIHHSPLIPDPGVTGVSCSQSQPSKADSNETVDLILDSDPPAAAVWPVLPSPQPLQLQAAGGVGGAPAIFRLVMLF